MTADIRSYEPAVMETYVASTAIDWSRVDVALGFWERLRGLIAAPLDRGLLIPTSSVHGFWMTRPLRLYGVDGAGRVVTSSVLRPWRIVTAPEASWMLEVPLAWPRLEVGSSVPVP